MKRSFINYRPFVLSKFPKSSLTTSCSLMSKPLSSKLLTSKLQTSKSLPTNIFTSKFLLSNMLIQKKPGFYLKSLSLQIKNYLDIFYILFQKNCFSLKKQ